MSLENTTNEGFVSLASAPTEELAIAQEQYSSSIKSFFNNAYKHTQGLLSNTSKGLSNLIDSYSERLKYNLTEDKENHAVPYSQKQKGFTLTELLVTIAITGGLMGILLPSLQRVRKEAEAVGCQSNQHQWGIAFKIDEEDINTNYLSKFQPFLRAYYDHDKMDKNSLRTKAKGIYLCPSAKKLGSPVQSVAPPYQPLSAWDGSKSSAWAYKIKKNFFISSYSVNTDRESSLFKKKNFLPENPCKIPILFDSTFRTTGLFENDEPPPKYDDMPRAIPTTKETTSCGVCINRHKEGINILFMDGSVKKTGLKELWTLEWNKGFDTKGPWTLNGGVQPNSWPKWMRKFKDY